MICFNTVKPVHPDTYTICITKLLILIFIGQFSMVFALNNLTVSHNAYLIIGRQVSLYLDIAIVNTVIQYINMQNFNKGGMHADIHDVQIDYVMSIILSLLQYNMYFVIETEIDYSKLLISYLRNLQKYM